jgi:outer membrane lipoprotein carrier protein
MRALAAALLLALAPAATPPDARALARKVQALYERTRDLEASFVQTYAYAGGRTLVSRGTLRLKKPGMMRWDYVEPEPKTIAVVGSRLVQWEPGVGQAYVDEHFDATAMSAAVTFLLGKGDLEREFEISSQEPGTLHLEPRRADPRVESVTLTVSADGEVTATRVVDGSGNANAMRFERIRRNVGLDRADFEVKLPRDVRHVGPGR